MLQVSDAITEIFMLLRHSNKYIDETTPWILAKDEALSDRLSTVIYNLLESIRVCGLLLEPFLPDTSNKIREQIRNYDSSLYFLSNNEYEVGVAEALFKRIVTNTDK